MLPAATAFYAGLLTLLYIGLSARVILYRRVNRISLGDGEDKNLLKRMRNQANFAEYTPLALVVLLLIELQGTSPVVVHLLGISLLAGRAMHAYGFGSTPQNFPLRQLGMVLTFGVLVVGVFWLLGQSLF